MEREDVFEDVICVWGGGVCTGRGVCTLVHIHVKPRRRCWGSSL